MPGVVQLAAWSGIIVWRRHMGMIWYGVLAAALIGVLSAGIMGVMWLVVWALKK
jgi:ABC-type uncharacterized transport system permease subunit